MNNKVTKIQHPIIESYVKNFIYQHEIEEPFSLDQHAVFEKYMNNLILARYTNDPNATYEDMETDTAFGIDGVAIFISDRIVTSIEDVDALIDGVKKFDVEFLFTQIKTSNQYDRSEIGDFLKGVRRFFNFNTCSIKELETFWEVAKYIYSKSSKFKKQPSLNLKFVCLSPKQIDLKDVHLKDEIDIEINGLTELNLFDSVELPEFIGIKEIMNLHSKLSSELEVSITLTKQPIPYPKDPDNKVKSGYYGLIRLEEFIKILTEEEENKSFLRKRIFDDNIRYYLGSNEKIEVNSKMKQQLLGEKSYLFGLLNNGITIICDEIKLNSEELTLTNYQIVNGCQTSNVIFETLSQIPKKEDIYLPIRLIATEDEDTKHNIIRATNSQTELKPEQLAALSSVQKALEEFYNTKRNLNNFDLYYERRTEQYRDDSIQKTKIINIPAQIKSTSALFFDLPHEVSGQYGKVEKQTRGLLFKDSDINYLNPYYVSGLAWYRVDRFIQNNEKGKKYRRARWHIIMLIKYYLCDSNSIEHKIDKKSHKNSEIMEKYLLDETKCNDLLTNILELIESYLSSEEGGLEKQFLDRKLFERKDTTIKLVEYVKSRNMFSD